MTEPTPIRQHRRYSKARKVEAVAIAVVEGVTETERKTGIPKETVQYWVTRPEFAHLRTTAREVVIEQFWVGIQVGLQEVVKGLQSDAPLNHKADALRTLAERFALLNGEATTRNESLMSGMNDHERDTLKGVILRAVTETP